MNLFGKGSMYAPNNPRAQELRQPAKREGFTLFGAGPAGQQQFVDDSKRQRLEDALNRIRAIRAIPEPFADKPIKVSTPYTYQPIKTANESSKLELAWTGLSLLSSRSWPLELGRMSISSTHRERLYERYLSPAQQKMVAQGYRLFINPVIAGDLNAFGAENNQKRLTGAQIKKLAQSFDQQFTFLGDFGTEGIFTSLVSYEFATQGSKQYEAGKATMHTSSPIGGMRGGGWDERTQQTTGAYWGITQFGSSTYKWIQSYARGWGVELPADRQSMTFGQMLVAAYVLAIIRQPTLVTLGIPVAPVTIYINHNQGDGVWKQKGAKKIKASAWDGQSTAVKSLLKSYGFVRG